jgi:hypothetical protein
VVRFCGAGAENSPNAKIALHAAFAAIRGNLSNFPTQNRAIEL